MTCIEFKEDLKRVKNLRDKGRQENKNSVNTALGFVGDEDYDGALLVDGGLVYSNEWVIDSSFLYHIEVLKEDLVI